MRNNRRVSSALVVVATLVLTVHTNAAVAKKSAAEDERAANLISPWKTLLSHPEKTRAPNVGPVRTHQYGTIQYDEGLPRRSVNLCNDQQG